MLRCAAMTLALIVHCSPQSVTPVKTMTWQYLAVVLTNRQEQDSPLLRTSTATVYASPTPMERSYLACVRRAESGSAISPGNYTWGWNPYGTGNGGGAYQMEPTTWRYATLMAGIQPEDHSRRAQDLAALALLRIEGSAPWMLDTNCHLN